MERPSAGQYIATISAPHEITSLVRRLESSLGLPTPAKELAGSLNHGAAAQAQRRAEATMARNDAPAALSSARA
jgi:hypothetical protein